MTLEEFENWLEDHKDEALARIEAEDLPLPRWCKHFGTALTIEARAYLDSGEEPIEDDDDDDDDGLTTEDEEEP